MQINEKEIPEVMIISAREWCASQADGFTAAQLEKHALRLGMEPACTMRFADRLIQMLKKKGTIRLDRKLRRWFPATQAEE